MTRAETRPGVARGGAAGVPWTIIAGVFRWVRGLEMPVLTRELRARMRGGRAALVMLVYVALLSMAAVGAVAWLGSLRPGMFLYPGPFTYGGAAHGSVGRELFMILALTQFGLVVLVSPGLTAGAISGEWERRTLEMLALTKISTGNIVLGKLVSSLCYVGLLLLCGAPVFGLTLVLGGVSPLEIVLSDVIAGGLALLFGSIGLLASALVPRTYAATAIAYGATGVLALGLPACLVSSSALVLLGGVMVAALVTGAARWAAPRYRPRWRLERVHYIGIFGVSLCGALTLLYSENILNDFGSWLVGRFGHNDPLELIAAVTSAPALIMGGLSFLGAGAAVIGTISLFRAMRAPRADSFETEARVARELRSQAPKGKAGS